MRARTENALLVVAAVAIVGFVVSFGLGLRGTAIVQGEDAIAARDYLNRGRPPRVEILNAAGRAGLAREATDRLRDAGFDVVYFGNASAPADSSYVLDRVGHADVARAIADALRISRTELRLDSTLYLEATVILGRDYSPGDGRD